MLADFFAQLDEWKQSWGGQLTAAHERQLYLLVAETLEAAGGPKKASEAHRFLLKYLATFTDQDLGAWFHGFLKGRGGGDWVVGLDLVLFWVWVA